MMDKCSFLFQFRTEHLDGATPAGENVTTRQIQREIFRIITREFFKSCFTQSKDYASYVTPIDRSRAHDARFSAGVKCTRRQQISFILMRCHPHEIGFGVARTITSSDNCVFCFEKHIALRIDQNCAERVVPSLTRTRSNANCHLQEFKITRLHSRVWNCPPAYSTSQRLA
jgi:hypothetical protein